ncbi:uncharacterized protein LOC120433265 isoform X1 [Oreochromis aureus]|uniref:Ig-like domain-containing protein n=1 Tax=Oreochromis aureus TaxID=47969 RepID=A0AAZ1XLB5_OREAU|nr:uncharacterized protein LOC120433265 isoform X1 [Oreochromis aureus]
MMAEFRWIHMFLSVILMLQLTGAHSGDLLLSFTVRDGDKVTLPCKNVINNHLNCDTTTWLFIDSRGKAAVELVNLGQIKEKAKSDRLSVTAECSLVIKKVTAEDVGRYTCRQFRGNPGKQQGLDAVVHLSVVIVTEQKKADQLTLNCSVQVYGRCKYKVKWIHNSVALDRDHSKFKTSQSSCSATVTFLKLQYSQISSSDFKCNITTEENKKQLFTFSTRSSVTSATTAKTTTRKTTTTTAAPPQSDNPGAALVWPYILVAVISAALLIFAVKLIVLKRGNKTQANENVDHEDGVSYISISYTNKAYSQNKVWGKCDSGEIVTYSTVKASSTDPSSLYATIK